MTNNRTNIFKKIYRIIGKFLLIFFTKILSPILSLFELTISPPYNKISNFKYIFSKETRRLVFDLKKIDSFNKIFIDTSFNKSTLCELGAKFSTNKSPFNITGSRSGFTGIYNLLFLGMRNKEINFAEIGIEHNASIKMWRDYFSLANIHAFEFDKKKIEKAKNDNLKNTFYHDIDVTNEPGIYNNFKKVNLKFDIIIDDSTHWFDNQIDIVKHAIPFLNNNGFLVIEDIHRFRKGYSEKDYYNSLKEFKHFFSEIVFIEASDVNNYTANWKNEKILLLVRNNKEILTL